MKHTIELKINNDLRRVSVNPWTTLAELLRELELTGVKISCDSGSCGSCTVLVNEKAVKSCLMLAVQTRGKNITTIEGLASENALHPLQQSFIEHFAVQCGFCTPGMILTAKTLLDETKNPTEEYVKSYLRGNICRCGSYVEIVDAVMAAAEKMRGADNSQVPDCID